MSAAFFFGLGFFGAGALCCVALFAACFAILKFAAGRD
jgi:hypothetical protein